MSNAKKGIWINDHEFRQFSVNQSGLAGEVATRQRAGELFGYGMILPNPDEVLRKMGQDITVYDRLLVDAKVGASVTSRKSGVKSLESGIDQGEAPTKVYDFVKAIFADLDMERIIGEILNAVLYGYQPLEISWKETASSIVPVDVVGKPQSWFVFDPDNQLRFRSLGSLIGEELPDMKFLLATHEATFTNPYGFPVLSRCFWPAAFKKGGWKFWVTFVEKYAGAFMVGKHPRGADPTEINALADMLETMIQSAIAVIPDDSTVEVKEAPGKGSSADIYERLITTCNQEISLAILGQTLTSEVSGNGSYAASKTHKTVLDEITMADSRVVMKTVNTLIRWVCDLNFGKGPRPTFKLWQEEDVDKDLADRDKTLADTRQIRFRKSYFVKTYGFAEEDIEEVAPAQTASVGPGLAFSEPIDQAPDFPGQTALDSAASGALKPEDLQAAADQMLRPFVELIKGGSSYENVMELLVKTFPKMDLDGVTRMLERVMFAAEVWGRLNAGR